MTVSYSLDNGDTWLTDLTGDLWPVNPGVYTLRLAFPSGTRTQRVMIRISGDDGTVWGVREIVLKVVGRPQEKSRAV